MEAIRWFEEIGLADVSLVGGKGANLGELTHAGLPVPPGFVVTAAAYLEAVSESGVRARLARLLGELNADDPISLTETQRAAREEIMATPIPAEITDAIRNAYRRLGDDVAVAVRSSGTTEDAGDSSFAGMNKRPASAPRSAGRRRLTDPNTPRSWCSLALRRSQ
jgi:pyruvate, water dikinase